MTIITNKKNGKCYFPFMTEDGKWTIHQMSRRYYWVKAWKNKNNSTFDTYEECEAELNRLSYSGVFGPREDYTVWCGEDERAKYVLGK